MNLKIFIGSIFLLSAATLSAESRLPTLHNGGAAYFQLEPGTFHLELFKRDDSKRASQWDTDRTFRARLFSPTRELLATLELPDAEKLGFDSDGWSFPVSGEMNVEIQRSGVYLLLVTQERNSYFTSVRWGFKTNADKFMIDAGGGHVDTARIEKIDLLRGSDSLQVVYKPKDPVYAFSVSQLPDTVKSIKIFGELGKCRHTVPAAEGRAAAVLTEDLPAKETLTVDLDDATSARVRIEGITTWQPDQTPRIPLWTTKTSAWFDVEKTRWILWPRYQKVFTGDSTVSPAKVALRNVLKDSQTVTFSINGGGVVPDQTVTKTLQPGETYPIQLDIGCVDKPAEITIRASVDGAPDEYAVVEVCPESADDQALELPFHVPPLRQNPEAFGLQSGTECGSRVYGELVDVKGREWCIGSNGLFMRDGGRWNCAVAADEAAFGVPCTTTELNTDTDGRVYALFVKSGRNRLLAVDGTNIVSVAELPESANGRILLESIKTTKPSAYPPILLMYKQVGPKITFWSANNSLTIYVPEWDDGQLKVESELVMATNCLGHCMSVAELRPDSAEVSNDVTYVVAYGITSPLPEFESDPGVPIYARTFKRTTLEMSDPVKVGYVPPRNDMHNVPKVMVDSTGYIHIILGGHNTSFGYTRSVKPGEIGSWLPLVEVASDYMQTYVHAVVGDDDTIHLVSRIWRRGPHFMPDEEYDTALIYQRKTKDQPWTAPRILVIGAIRHYAHYLHRFGITPSGRLRLAWSYWSTWSSYRNELPTLAPNGDSSMGYLSLISDDDGESWKFDRGLSEKKHQSTER